MTSTCHLPSPHGLTLTLIAVSLSGDSVGVLAQPLYQIRFTHEDAPTDAHNARELTAFDHRVNRLLACAKKHCDLGALEHRREARVPTE